MNTHCCLPVRRTCSLRCVTQEAPVSIATIEYHAVPRSTLSAWDGGHGCLGADDVSGDIRPIAMHLLGIEKSLWIEHDDTPAVDVYRLHGIRRCPRWHRCGRRRGYMIGA